jgi:nitric oxide reductase NorQ protein
MSFEASSGLLEINGIQVHYTRPAPIREGTLKYVDVFNLLPLIDRASFDQLSRHWDPPNLLLSGYKGTGKSLLFAYLSQQHQIPYLALDCSEETRERHIRGGFIAKNGCTPFVLGTVANAIQVANECGACILVLEEINALSPQRQKELNPLTDFRKKIEVPELSYRFELSPNAKLLVAATMNPAVYGGTYELNEDLKSRFLEIEVPYPPPGAEKRILMEMVPEAAQYEKIVEDLIKIAKETRQSATGYALSPRDLVQILKLVPRVGFEEALFFTAQKFSDNDRNLVVSRIADVTNLSVFLDLNHRAGLKPGQ